MPYAENADLPDSVRSNLSEGAQTIYRKAFNAAFEQYDSDEARASRVAWAAVKNIYEKKGDKWVKKDSLPDVRAAVDAAYAKIEN